MKYTRGLHVHQYPLILHFFDVRTGNFYGGRKHTLEPVWSPFKNIQLNEKLPSFDKLSWPE